MSCYYGDEGTPWMEIVIIIIILFAMLALGALLG
jgi:hypothetical protein